LHGVGVQYHAQSGVHLLLLLIGPSQDNGLGRSEFSIFRSAILTESLSSTE